MQEESSLRFFFFNDTATTEIYTLSLHDALPISDHRGQLRGVRVLPPIKYDRKHCDDRNDPVRYRHEVYWDCRSEEHTSELQSRQYLVCRLLLEKKKKLHIIHITSHLDLILFAHS